MMGMFFFAEVYWCLLVICMFEFIKMSMKIFFFLVADFFFSLIFGFYVK